MNKQDNLQNKSGIVQGFAYSGVIMYAVSALLLIYALSFFLASLNVYPSGTDDYVFSMSLWKPNGFINTINCFLASNQRLLISSILFAGLFSFGMPYFSIINPFLVVLLVASSLFFSKALIDKICAQGTPKSYRYALAAISAFIIVISFFKAHPIIRAVMIWPAGAVTYSLPMAEILFLAGLLIKTEGSSFSFKKALLIAVLTFLIGTAQETFTIYCLCFTISCLFLRVMFTDSRKRFFSDAITKYLSISAVILSVILFVMILYTAATGSAQRWTWKAPYILEYSWYKRVCFGLYWSLRDGLGFLRHFLLASGIIVPALGGFLASFITRLYYDGYRFKRMPVKGNFLVAINAAFIISFFGEFVWYRYFSGVILWGRHQTIIVLCSALNILCAIYLIMSIIFEVHESFLQKHKKGIKRASAILSVIFFAYLAFNIALDSAKFIQEFWPDMLYKQKLLRRHEQLKELAGAGRKRVEIEILYPPSDSMIFGYSDPDSKEPGGYDLFDDIRTDPQMNGHVAYYYGFEEIVGVKRDRK